MRFLVGTGHPDVVDAFDEPPELLATRDDVLDAIEGRRATGPSAADRSTLEASSDVLLVHTPTYEGDVHALVEDVRATPSGDDIPIVLLAQDTSIAKNLAVDGVVDLPADARTIRRTADRAITIEAYRTAVGQFYDACREWSGEEFDHSLLERRYEADQLFSDLAPIETDVPICTLIRERSERDQ